MTPEQSTAALAALRDDARLWEAAAWEAYQRTVRTETGDVNAMRGTAYRASHLVAELDEQA